MAPLRGRLKYCIYVDDSGKSHLVRIGRANAEATINGIAVMKDHTYQVDVLPTGFKMRYVMAFLNKDPSIKRKFYVGNPITLKEVLSAPTVIRARPYLNWEITDWTVTYYKGEKVRLLPGLSQFELDKIESDRVKNQQLEDQ